MTRKDTPWKHTHAPWRVTLAPMVPPLCTNFRIEEHTHSEVIVLDETGEEIDPEQSDFTYKIATAHLISVAPEMLAMLESIYDTHGTELFGSDEIRDLIAKAKGGSS